MLTTSRLGLTGLFLFLLGACEAPAPVHHPVGDAPGRHKAELRPTDTNSNLGWRYQPGENVEAFGGSNKGILVHFSRTAPNGVPTADTDGDGTPDYVESVAHIYESVAAKYQNELGFRAPLTDASLANNGGDGRFDVYLLDFGRTADGNFMSDQCQNDRCIGYVQQENDFVGYNYPSIEEAVAILGSHEYFHGVQDAYDTSQDVVFLEGTAVWATEQFDPSSADFENYIEGYLSQPDRSLDSPPPGPVPPFAYGSAIFFQFLSEKYGTAIIRELLERIENGKGDPSLSTDVADPKWTRQLDLLLKKKYESSFAEAFTTFAQWNLYLRVGGAAPQESYAQASSYPAPAMQTVSAPYQSPTPLRAYYAATKYFKAASAGREQLGAVLIDDPKTAEDETAGLKLLLAVRRNGKNDQVLRVADVKVAQTLDTSGKADLVVAVVNTAHEGFDGQLSKRPGLCIGSPEELLACRKALDSSFDAGVVPEPDAGTADAGGDSDPGVVETPPKGGCGVAPASGAATALCVLTLMWLLPLVRARKRAGSIGLFVLLLFGCEPPKAGVEPDAGTELDGGAQADGGGEDAGVIVKDGPFVLLPGEVGEVALTDGQGSVWLATPNGDEQFIAVLASTRLDGSKTSSSYSVRLDQEPKNSGIAKVTGCAIRSEDWSSQGVTHEPPPSGNTVAVGTVKSIKVSTPTGGEAIDVKAIAVGASGRAVVWADVSEAHPATLDSQFAEKFLADFEDVILPRAREIFGVESDLDHDGRISLVFSPLTHQTAVAFFDSCDLKAGCTGSNSGEYLYLTPPANIQPPYNTPNAIKEILSHELSHLIHFNRKVLKNQLSKWTDSAYMDEGIGGFAQDVLGPQAGNLHVAKSGLDGIDKFSLAMTLNNQALYDSTRDGLLRGGSYWFVRYLYDRAGADAVADNGTITGRGGPAFLRALLDDPASVADALPKLTNSSREDIATDFFTTLAMSNRAKKGGVAAANPCFEYLPTTTDPYWKRQRGADVYAEFTFKMTGPFSQEAAKADGKLLPGGVEYLKLDATAAGAGISVAVSTEPSSLARWRIGRIR